MEELECYNQKYKKRLDEVGALGEIPDDLALEVMHGSYVLYSCSDGKLFGNNDCFFKVYLVHIT